MLKAIASITPQLESEEKIRTTYYCAGPAPFLDALKNSDSPLYRLLERLLNLTLVDLNDQFTRFNESKYPWTHPRTADAVTFGRPEYPELLNQLAILNSSYHHIPDDLKLKFLKNLAENLAPGGTVIMGENFLPNYTDLTKRQKAVDQYYAELLEFYKKDLDGIPKANAKQIEQLQNSMNLIQTEVRQADLTQNGEFKNCLAVLKKQLEQVGLVIREIHQVWPHTVIYQENEIYQPGFDDKYYGSGVFVLKLD